MDRWGISPHNFAAGRSGAGKIDFNPILSKKNGKLEQNVECRAFFIC
jgi:hypothetical protein